MPVLTENPQQQVVRKGILMVMIKIRVVMMVMVMIMVLFLEVVVIFFSLSYQNQCLQQSKTLF